MKFFGLSFELENFILNFCFIKDISFMIVIELRFKFFFLLFLSSGVFLFMLFIFRLIFNFLEIIFLSFVIIILDISYFN